MRAIVVRLDNDGDVLLAGPAIRAVAAGADHVTLLCGPRGAQAAKLLPGVDEIVVRRAEWIDPDAPPVDRAGVDAYVDRIAAIGADAAVILTSFHQSALPTALLLRMAGVPRIAAISEDFPGSLLDVRHRVDEDVHEVQRGLSVAATLGFALPPGDDGALRVHAADPPAGVELPDRFVAVHPGASVPARAWEPDANRALVAALAAAGRSVVVTGAPSERALTAHVTAGWFRSANQQLAEQNHPNMAPAGGSVERTSGSQNGTTAPGGSGGDEGPAVLDLGGATSLAELAGVLARADAVVVGNTGPAHLAAAVGTPVVSLFAPTVPAVKWRPWSVPHELLFVDVPCAGCRARECPVAGHPCLSQVPVEDVLAALDRLTAPIRKAVAA
ncbi:MAG TPA: glycosyltransferase family 9 protein [Baekduia sp.]|nr:glycosyltransferase family 9 protein [Baekduia sp.]